MIDDINTRYMAEFPEKHENHCTLTKKNDDIKIMYDAKMKNLAQCMIRNGDEAPILILADI